MLGNNDIKSLADRALFSELQKLVLEVSNGIEEYRLSQTGERLYSFVWDYYCDWYLELSKGTANPTVLVDSMRIILQLLHPYCPFVTEELWSHFYSPKASKMLIKNPWPVFTGSFQDKEAEKEFGLLRECITGIRSLRSEEEVPTQEKVQIFIKPFLPVFSANVDHIRRLASVEHILSGPTIRPDGSVGSPDTFPFFPGTGYEIILFRSHAYDAAQMKNDLHKRKKNLEAFRTQILAKLNNEKFCSNADPDVVILEKEKLSSTEQKLQKIERRLKALN